MCMDKLPVDCRLSPHNHRLNDLSVPKRLGGGSAGCSRIQWGAGWRGLMTLSKEGCLFLDLPQPSAFMKNRTQSGDAFVDLDAQVEPVHRSHSGNALIIEHGSFKAECLVKEILHLGSQAVIAHNPLPRIQAGDNGRCSCAESTFHRNNHMFKGPEDDYATLFGQ